MTTSERYKATVAMKRSGAAKPIGVRLYEKHRVMVKRLAHTLAQTEGEVVRIAIEEMFRRRS